RKTMTPGWLSGTRESSKILEQPSRQTNLSKDSLHDARGRNFDLLSNLAAERKLVETPEGITTFKFQHCRSRNIKRRGCGLSLQLNPAPVKRLFSPTPWLIPPKSSYHPAASRAPQVRDTLLRAVGTRLWRLWRAYA